MNTRSRLLTILMVVFFLLIIHVIRNSFNIDKLLGKLGNFQDGVEATRRREELTVHPNGNRLRTATSVQYGDKSSPYEDGNTVWNDNFKRATTGSSKTDNLKVYPSKQVPQTTTTQEHDKKDLNIYPKNDGKYSGYGETNCKWTRNRHTFAKLFEHWIQLAKREKIEYFLSCGTLLGAYRNGDLIPHDTDIDILVNRSDFLKIKKNSTMKNFSPYGKEIHVYVNKDFYKPFENRRRFKCSGEVVSAQIDHCSFQELLGRVITEGHYMDIYDYTQKGDILSDPSDGGRTFHVNEVYPLRKCHLMGFETLCPNDPVKFLGKFYGNNLAPNFVCKNGTWVRKN